MLFLPLMSPAYAARVPDLYQAEAQVSGEDPEQREPAFREALGKVLIKVTGSRSILTRGSLTGGLDDAASFVQQFRYRVDSLDDSGKEPHRSLWVSFDKALVDRFLAERRLPVWSENRPAVLVWLGVEARGKRQLFDPERNQPERTTVEAAAAERGLAMVFPIMDLEDQTQMQVADLWGSFESNIRLASQRYAPEQILTIRMVAAERIMVGLLESLRPGRDAATALGEPRRLLGRCPRGWGEPGSRYPCRQVCSAARGSGIGNRALTCQRRRRSDPVC